MGRDHGLLLALILSDPAGRCQGEIAARARHRLATPILLLFLRSGPATPIITLAIPVSVVASFVAMAAMGRSIHVISPAGLAFSVGMVVDAAIVVLENIYRPRRQGLAPARTAYQGARQVWARFWSQP
jgi:HAE1 family hydrophobic/amphiphilic exporter-1